MFLHVYFYIKHGGKHMAIIALFFVLSEYNAQSIHYNRVLVIAYT